MPRVVAGPPSQAAPSTYKLAPAEAFVPESVTATFNGSGAASSFLPCLSIYAQSGELLSRTFPNDAIAAGGSAEVTYAPFLRETGSSSGTAAPVVWGYGDSRITNGAGGFMYPNMAIAAGNYNNKLPVHFAASSDTYGTTFSVGHDQDGDCGWQLDRPGIYRIMISAETYNDVAANGPGRCAILFDWTDTLGNGGQDDAFNRIPKPRYFGANFVNRYNDQSWMEAWLPVDASWSYPITLRIYLGCEQNSFLSLWYVTAHRIGDYDSTNFVNIFSTAGAPQC